MIAQRVWADAIFIDQGNHSEKINQVTLMGKIFNHSKRVVVWLGEGQNKTVSVNSCRQNFEM
jgi:hypothetical protein